MPKEGLAGTVFLRELGLDGRRRAVPVVLPSVAAAVAAGFSRVVVPVEKAVLRPASAGLSCRWRRPRRQVWSLRCASWPRPH